MDMALGAKSLFQAIGGIRSGVSLAPSSGSLSAMTNAAPLVLPPFGSRPMLGTNPISVAAPTSTGAPFILDMATSAVAAGMFCIAVNADVHERPELHAAQHHITSLTEFGPPEVQRLFVADDEDDIC